MKRTLLILAFVVAASAVMSPALAVDPDIVYTPPCRSCPYWTFVCNYICFYSKR